MSSLIIQFVLIVVGGMFLWALAFALALCIWLKKKHHLSMREAVRMLQQPFIDTPLIGRGPDHGEACYP